MNFALLIQDIIRQIRSTGYSFRITKIYINVLKNFFTMF